MTTQVFQSNANTNIWFMSPYNKNIRQIKYDFDIKTKFPDGFECHKFEDDDTGSYYVVFFDAEDGGTYNASAKWIAPTCGVFPTGNFIIMRKKWGDDAEEHTIEMDISPKDFKAKYLSGRNE